MRGDIMHDYVLEKGLSTNPGLADTQADALRLLASERYEYALVAQLPGLYWVKKLGLSNILIVGPLLHPSAYCYGMKKGNIELLSDFDEGLAILKKTNEIQEIYNKWLGVLEPKGVPRGTIMKYVGLSLLILLLILATAFVWIRTLKSQVAQRTKELKEEITERESAEAALRKSEFFSRKLLSSLPAGIVIVDPATRIIEHVNYHVATLFGAPVDDLVGNRCHTFLCPADEGACPVCDLGQEIDNSDRKMLRKDGCLLPILKTVKRVEINGKDKLLECFVDASERKLAEKALQESEKRFSTLFHASPVYIALTAFDDGRFLDVNESFTKITGYERKEVLGRTPIEIGLWVDPEKGRSS
jgi:PAS domain S-box-containing protein